MFEKLLTSILFIAVFNGALLAQAPSERLRKAFADFENDPQTRHAISSICILDASTGDKIFAKNEDIGLAPASTLKTITSATALELLGPDFRYSTSLVYSGSISPDGTLQGDLIIKGGGDPTLGSWRYPNTKEKNVLDQWVTAVRQAGIRKITGRIIGDDLVWGSPQTPDGWIWQDIGNYYGAAASGLSWRENQFDIHLSTIGGKVSVTRIVPEMPYIRIVNEISSGARGSGDQVYAYLPPLSNTAYLRGTWASGIAKSGISVALPEPAYDAALRLRDTLSRLGIPATGDPSTGRRLTLAGEEIPAAGRALVTLNSPSLADIVYLFNQKSINLYGEHLIRTLAWKAGKKATTAAGVDLIVNHWVGRGVARGSLKMLDGSGLSPANRVSTAAMATVLYRAQSAPWFTDFLKSLPLNNGMRLKSGTISDVLAYAGYHTSGAGRKYVVVINVNNYSGSGIKSKLFAVLDALK
ncbi:D-alanyl-D-alanine carboxypeptidase/D-alanyl-D-alanine endopeptidase [Pedobacter faecalis]|uniref:D-alanyl-D-alanine carboxypeptidase/D-alanyl-D-alanine endopeptidase n=1 Tax=Pedobacter faecalis TaxID=3041495 RepID=UPI00254BA4A8|nr:D-alanyl-D-alanine carboxypeptidase/D-alanyl-D-alanine-endopeptidase [Pedobacter sp. ELA7]